MDYIYDFEKYVKNINEGFIKTYDINKTVIGIDTLLNRYNLNFSIEIIDNIFKVNINDFDKIPNLDDILEIFLSTIFNLYGWFPSTMKMTNFFLNEKTMKFRKEELLRPVNNLLKVTITFESKFDEIISNIPDKLYHLTIQQYENDILKNGLLPKSKSKLTAHDYDGRIYLCDIKEKCIALIPSMKRFYSDEKFNIVNDIRNSKKIYNKNTKWIIFEIDSKPAGINILYKDPNYLNGYYYLDFIKPISLKIIDKEI